MRRAVSFLLVSAFLVSGIPAVSAQKKRNKKLERPATTVPEVPAPTIPSSGEMNLKANQTKFGFTRAYTQGEGVWVHWQMDAEIDNNGFYVYRIDSNGGTRISEMEPGAAFKFADGKVYGEQYSFFDEAGTAASLYYVEARGSKRNVISDLISVSPVNDLPKIAGASMFEYAPRVEERVRPTTIDLSLPKDLRAEVTANALAPNPSRHLNVVSQPGVKIKAKASGLIRVTRAELQAAGFTVNTNAGLWQLYLEGNELPIIIGPNADYIEFLGKELDTVESDIRTYYLIVGNTAGKRARVTSLVPRTGSVLSTKYDQTFVRKERTNYINQVLNGDSENFWGRIVSSVGTDFTFNLTGIDRTPGDRTMTVAFQGFSTNAHDIEVRLNGNLLPNAVGFFRNAYKRTYSFPVSFLLDGVNTLSMKATTSGDTSLFDYVSIDFPRAYKAENNRLDFFTATSRKTVVSGFTSPNVRLFDVTYEGELVELVNNTIVETAGTFGPVIPANRSRVYYATEANNFSTPISVLPNDPGLLGVPTNAGTLVVITHSSLMTEAQAWAAYRAGQGISTKVVDVEEIFDEFNYGVPNSFAIEGFLNYAKNNWLTPPSYVLLIGDATYDPKNYHGNGYWNLVPTRMVNTLFEETGSDEALADFNNDGLSEIPIGRISSRTGAGVTTVFNKTVAWEAGVTPNVLDKGALFAYDQPEGYDFKAMSERLMAKLPAGMPKVTAERGLPDATAAKNTVINAFDSGKYIANYSGHGTSAAWKDTGFFWNGDISSLTNGNSPTLVTALTCLNAYFVQSNNNDSFAETITKAPNGGAVAIWASTGKTTPDVQEVMALRFYEQITLGNITRLGDLINDAKAQLIGGGDVRRSWALIGDPMLKVR